MVEVVVSFDPFDFDFFGRSVDVAVLSVISCSSASASDGLGVDFDPCFFVFPFFFSTSFSCSSEVPSRAVDLRFSVFFFFALLFFCSLGDVFSTGLDSILGSRRYRVDDGADETVNANVSN